jgi:Amidohydrolase
MATARIAQSACARWTGRGLIIALAMLGLVAADSPRTDSDYLFNDVHFHLTNYVQTGTDVHRYVQMMGHRIGRSALFGIPLQQTWDYANSGKYAPTYYLQSDAPLYYYSFTDAYIARVYQSLPQSERDRLDPMITGFNPADMYGVDHIRRVLTLFPGVFTGIGEFTIHKEFVSGKVCGVKASLTTPALDRILSLAAEAGLVVLMHNDIDMPFSKAGSSPVYLEDLKSLFRRHPDATIIWAHLGLGRVVHPTLDEATADTAERSPAFRTIVEQMLNDPTLKHVDFDISWDEVAKYAIASPQSIERTAAVFNQYPDRFLFGTDVVAPTDASAQLRVYEMWRPIWARLTPEASFKIRRGNYERIFDTARKRVRAWEAAHSK